MHFESTGRKYERIDKNLIRKFNQISLTDRTYFFENHTSLKGILKFIR